MSRTLKILVVINYKMLQKSRDHQETGHNSSIHQVHIIRWFSGAVNQGILSSTHRKCHKNVHLKSRYNMKVFILSEYKHPHHPTSLYSANIKSLQIRHFLSEYLQCNKMKSFCNVAITSKPVSTLIRWQSRLSHHALGLSVTLKWQTQTVWTILIKPIELVYSLYLDLSGVICPCLP